MTLTSSSLGLRPDFSFLANPAHMPKLECLTLQFVGATAVTWQALARALPLLRLEVYESSHGDALIETLGACGAWSKLALKELALPAMGVSEVGAKALVSGMTAEHLPQLERLTLSCNTLGYNAIAAVAEALVSHLKHSLRPWATACSLTMCCVSSRCGRPLWFSACEHLVVVTVDKNESDLITIIQK